jgi:hypothetical protein
LSVDYGRMYIEVFSKGEDDRLDLSC